MAKEMDVRNAAQFYQTLYDQNDSKQLPNIVKYLISLRKEHNNGYLMFKGHRLYTANVTMESAFMDVFGCTLEDLKTYAKGISRLPDDKKKERFMKLHELIQKNRADQRAGAKKLEGIRFVSVEDAVEYLQDKKRDGENVYIMFKGCKLYSNDVTVKSAKRDIENASKQRAKDEDSDMKIATPGKIKASPFRPGKMKKITENPEADDR